MYQKYFNLNSLPFENSPDPDFFFMGHRYREILALMIHGVVSRKGLICISGPIGSGKTTLATVLTGYLPADALVINMAHPKASPGEMLIYLARQLGLTEYPETPLLLTEAIRQELVKLDSTDRHCVLIIDESQYMSDALMQEIVVLTNLETPLRKLIQILMLGQKEFVTKLNRPELRQLKHRIFVTRSLAAMDPEQTFQYIRHRLQVASGDPAIFSTDALELIFKYSGGIPRLINRLCDAALLGAFTAQNQSVEEEEVRKANVDLGMELDTRVPRYRQTLRRPGMMRRQTLSANLRTSEIQAEPSPPDQPAESDRALEKTRNQKTAPNAASSVTGRSLDQVPSVRNRKMIHLLGRSEGRNHRLKLILVLFIVVLTVAILLNLRGKNVKPALISEVKPDKPEENTILTSLLKFLPAPGLNPKAGPSGKTDNASDEIQTNPSAENRRAPKRIKFFPMPRPIPQIMKPDKTVDDLKAELRRAHSSSTGAKAKTIHQPMKTKPAISVKPLLADSDNSVIPTGVLSQKKVDLSKNNGHDDSNLPETQLKTVPDASLTGVATEKMTTYPYSVFLDTLATYPKAVIALARFKKNGLNPYWVKVEPRGRTVRFNIFSGYFESVEQAAIVIQKLRKKGAFKAIVMKVPYAALIGNYSSPDALINRRQQLEMDGYAPYCIPVENQVLTHLYIGAFYTFQDAENRCSELIGSGIPCQAVER